MASVSTTYDETQAVMLAVLLLRHKTAFDSGARFLYDAGMFNKDSSLKIAMERALILREQHKLPLSLNALRQETGLVAEAQKLPEDKRNTIQGILELAFETKEFESDKDYVFEVADAEYKKYLIRTSCRDVATMPTADATVSLKKTTSLLTRSIFARPPIIRPFSNILAHVHEAARKPTGIDFLDKILGGGTVSGEMLGYLAPSGGGKTTLAVNLCEASVLQKEGHLHVTVEQGFVGDLAIRFATLAARCKRKDFKDPTAIPEAVREEILHVADNWQKYFVVLDLSQTIVASVDGLFELVDEAENELGLPIKRITFDWWGRFRNRLVRSQRSHLTDAQIRVLQSEWLDDFRLSIGRRDMVGHVFHQLSGEAASKGAKHRASSNDAQEDKNFNNLFDFCFVIGKMTSKEQICRFSSDKARSAASVDMFLKLEGEMCRFREATMREVPNSLKKNEDHAIGESDDYGVT